MGFLSYEKLADYIINYCQNKNTSISNKKLQKLVFYCQAWSLALDDEKLIDGEFETWVHGAVLRPLYFKYADFGYNNINIDAQRANKIQEEVERILPSRKLTLVDKVLGKYALYTADELERLNHGEDPWCKARACLDADEIGKNIITTESMKDYYRSKAVEKGMRTMKKDKFNFSSARLKKAQEELNNKEVFKVTEDNAEEYKEFILKSQKENALLARRAEYAQALQDK